MDAGELYRAGKLTEAIEALTADVRSHPTDVAKRGFLAELLCVAGDIERADKQLDAIGRQEPEAQVGVSLMRQLIRAEQARRDHYREGRLPEFLSQPPEHVELALRGSVALREGDKASAQEFLEKAEEARPKVGGQCGDAAFADLRDLDDVNAGYFEALTSTGKYYWIPFESVAEVSFHQPERPRDLLWVAAQMSVRGGPDGVVYVPAIYVAEDETDAERLGRSTDWDGGEGEPIRGRGLRTYLVDEEAKTIFELGELAFGTSD